MDAYLPKNWAFHAQCHLYLRGMRFGVDPRIDTKKDMNFKTSRMCVQNMIPILSSIINIIRGDLYDHLMSTRHLHFDMEQDFHMNFRKYGKSSYVLNVNLLSISY